MNITLATLSIVMLCAVIGLAAAIFWNARISQFPAGSPAMVNIAGLIRTSAMAFLKKEYSVISIVMIVVGTVLFFVFDNGGIPKVTACFFLGAVASLLAGFIGMVSATKANVRTTEAARTSVGAALHVAFLSSSALGLSVAGLGLLGLTGALTTLSMLGDSWQQALEALTAFGLGASSVALFMRVGGGIYTKAADIGADLVGKVESGISEDDPRNPAVIADAVGDNVGGVAGAGADAFESYVCALIAAMVIGASSENGRVPVILFPLVIAGLGILASIIARCAVRIGNATNVSSVLHRGLIVSTVIMLGGGYLAAEKMLGAFAAGTMTALAAGIGAGIIIGLLTEYYTSSNFVPVKHIAKASETGAATNILAGLALGYVSTAAPILVLSLAIGISYAATDPSNFYGVAIAALGMLSTLGTSLAIGAFGAVVDNASGIAEMGKLPADVRKNTDELDADGSAALAIGKGFSIGSAILVSLALFFAFSLRSHISVINLKEPTVLIGLLVGGMLPFLFCSMILNAVGRAAHAMIHEIRRQFKEIPGLLAGKTKGNPARCISMSTSTAMREMIAPGMLAISAPIVVGLVLGATALGGMLVGSIITGTLLAISMTNSGSAWDNAKNCIESGKFGGKNSALYKAAVIGDTIGDPLKDACGPALGILIKLISIVSLLTAGFYATNGMVG